MGAQHGRLDRPDAARLLGFYRTMPERMLAGDLGAPARLAVRALATAWQARLAKGRPAELAARTRAFVDAVAELAPGHDTRTGMLALATMDTMQNCVVARRPRAARPVRASRCAGASPRPPCPRARPRSCGAARPRTASCCSRATSTSPGVGVWDAAPAFVVCKPAGGDRGQRYGFFTTRGADTPVVTVVNEAGLVLAPHTRWHADVTWGGAMIVDLVHDIARRAETLADAIAIARERPSSSSWGIAIGSARERTGARDRARRSRTSRSCGRRPGPRC